MRQLACILLMVMVLPSAAAVRAADVDSSSGTAGASGTGAAHARVYLHRVGGETDTSSSGGTAAAPAPAKSKVRSSSAEAALRRIFGAAQSPARADADSSGGTAAAPLPPPDAEIIVPPAGVPPAGVMAPGATAGAIPLPAVQAAPPPAPVAAPVIVAPVFQNPPYRGYAADSSIVGPLVDWPATLNVVPPDLLEDQQIIRFGELLRDVPGAVKAGDDQWPDAFLLRGYFVNPQDFRKDGFVDPTLTPRDFTNIDHVEFLQGPDALLYGPWQTMGAVNLVTKQPVNAFIQQGSVETGSFGLQHYTIDFNRPLYDDSTSAFRINADYLQDDGFRAYGFDQGVMAAPALTWELDHDTSITWEGEFVSDRRRYDTGVAAVNGQLVLPISRFLGEPTDDQFFQDYRESLVLRHRIDADWSWSVGGYSLFSNTEGSATIPTADVPGSPGSFYRTAEDIGPSNYQYQSMIVNLEGTVEIGPATHHLVFGNEEGWYTSDFEASRSSTFFTPLEIDGFAPVYGNVPSPVLPAEIFGYKFYRDDYGFYFQDLVELTDHWKLLAGIRYDHSDVVFDRVLDYLGGVSSARSVETFDVGTPRVGVIYEPVPQRVSCYATYAATFDPPEPGPYLTGGPLAPEFAQVWECGVKVVAAKGLTLAASAFYITKENVTVYYPDGFHLYQASGERSDGVELSLVGKLTDRWSVLADYTYDDTRMSDPAAASPIGGQRALGVPYNSGNIWTRYNLIADDCRTLGVGLGMVSVGDRSGDYFSPLVLPSYTRWDAGLFYRYKRLDMNLYVENLFGAVYYTSSINQFEVFPGAPTTFKGQLTWRF